MALAWELQAKLGCHLGHGHGTGRLPLAASSYQRRAGAWRIPRQPCLPHKLPTGKSWPLSLGEVPGGGALAWRSICGALAVLKFQVACRGRGFPLPSSTLRAVFFGFARGEWPRGFEECVLTHERNSEDVVYESEPPEYRGQHPSVAPQCQWWAVAFARASHLRLASVHPRCWSMYKPRPRRPLLRLGHWHSVVSPCATGSATSSVDP